MIDEYCDECRHPVIWHSHPSQAGRCCGCELHRLRSVNLPDNDWREAKG